VALTARKNEMAKFIIQPLGRLLERISDETGYFRDEVLDY